MLEGSPTPTTPLAHHARKPALPTVAHGPATYLGLRRHGAGPQVLLAQPGHPGPLPGTHPDAPAPHQDGGVWSPSLAQEQRQRRLASAPAIHLGPRRAGRAVRPVIYIFIKSHEKIRNMITCLDAVTLSLPDLSRQPHAIPARAPGSHTRSHPPRETRLSPSPPSPASGTPTCSLSLLLCEMGKVRDRSALAELRGPLPHLCCLSTHSPQRSPLWLQLPNMGSAPGCTPSPTTLPEPQAPGPMSRPGTKPLPGRAGCSEGTSRPSRWRCPVGARSLSPVATGRPLGGLTAK